MLSARWYDPVVGRFMAIDPVGFEEANPQSFNRFTYANNNPYKYVDPDGRENEILNGSITGPTEARAYIENAAFSELPRADFLDFEGEGIITPVAGVAGAAAKTSGKIVTKTGTKGASGELRTLSGKKYHGNSTGSSASGGNPRAPMHPETQKALDGVQNPSRTHGLCCEIDAINKALNAGDAVRGAKMGPVRLNESGRTIPACSTCRVVKRALGVE